MENIVRVSIVIEARVEIWENDKLKRELELKGSAIFVVISRKRLTIVYLCLSVYIYIYTNFLYFDSYTSRTLRLFHYYFVEVNKRFGNVISSHLCCRFDRLTSLIILLFDLENFR